MLKIEKSALFAEFNREKFHSPFFFWRWFMAVKVIYFPHIIQYTLVHTVGYCLYVPVQYSLSEPINHAK